MTWKTACSLDAVPDGGLKQVEVEGVPILLARIGGECFAYPPLCPHQEEVLAQSGVCDGKVMTCTKHLWQWDLRSGQPRGLAEKSLLMYPARVEAGAVQVLVEQELTYGYDDEDEDD